MVDAGECGSDEAQPPEKGNGVKKSAASDKVIAFSAGRKRMRAALQRDVQRAYLELGRSYVERLGMTNVALRELGAAIYSLCPQTEAGTLSKVWNALKRENLKKALRALENKCLPSTREYLATGEAKKLWRYGRLNAGDLAGLTLWPSGGELGQLTRAVIDLAVVARRNGQGSITSPFWKAFKTVDRRWPGFQLVPRVEQLVQRARNRLKETGGSGFQRLTREANDGMPEAIQLRKDLRALYEDSTNALQIRLQDKQSDMKCYPRALELIVDELRYRPLLHERVRPLLDWIACVGNPDFFDVLTFDDLTNHARELMTVQTAAEIVKRKQEQARLRKRNQRDREKQLQKAPKISC
jgi:hypothetical protein